MRFLVNDPLLKPFTPAVPHERIGPILSGRAAA